MNRTFHESLNAQSATQAAVTALAQMGEQMHAQGRYHATCVESVPQHRTTYLDLFARKAQIENMSLAGRIAHIAELDEIEKRMADIPTQIKWEDAFENVVCTVGKNQMLDAALSGSSYSVTGPFMGLISSVSYTAVAAADVMGQLAGTNGWREAGGTNAPTYSGGRKTAAWSAATGGSKSLSAALSFGMTGTGTVKGCFLVYGSGAVATVDNTGGILYSAGLFTGGDQPVVNGNTLNVSYTTSL